jgi:hypothetical protein
MASLKTFGLSAVLLTICLLAVMGAAAGQASGSLELVAQSSWVDDGGIFNLQVRAAGAKAGSSVLLNVYAPHESRSDLATRPEVDESPVLRVGPLPLDDLQGTSNEVLSLELAIAGPGIEPSDPELNDEGIIPVLQTEAASAVYPLEIVLQDEEGVIADTILTTLITLPRGVPTSPLQVVVLLESQLPIGLREDGRAELDETAGADLLPILEAFALHPGVDG